MNSQLSPQQYLRSQEEEKTPYKHNTIKGFAYVISSIRTVTHELLILELKIMGQDVLG